MDLAKYSYGTLQHVATEMFSLHWLPVSFERKLLLIAMICYITNNINKNRAENGTLSCYQIICKIGAKSPESVKDTYFKSLGALCDSLMAECKEFPTFGIDPKAMPKEALKILNEWYPF